LTQKSKSTSARRPSPFCARTATRSSPPCPNVALSIVGTDRTPDNGYFRAKVAQEKLIETSGIPYTIIRSTQFLEFLGGIAASSADRNIARLSPGLFQPIAADDVAAIVADVALAGGINTITGEGLKEALARREAASSKSPVRNEHRSTRSSPAI
jgi:uncharacterized protein YbjT (DUF2867 family)